MKEAQSEKEEVAGISFVIKNTASPCIVRYLSYSIDVYLSPIFTYLPFSGTNPGNYPVQGTEVTGALNGCR